MKKILSVVALFVLASTSSFAANRVLWSCDGTNIEGAGIAEVNGALAGNLTWDCWPGGGICNAKSLLSAERNNTGDLVYKGQYFQLVIHTSSAPLNGAYKAHLMAKDEVDSANAGRGLTFNQYVTCRASH